MDGALALVERSSELTRSVDSMNHQTGTMIVQGVCLVLAGQPTAGISLLEQGRALTGQIAAWTATMSNRLGEAYLAAGRIEDARREAETALSTAEARQERASRAVALRLLGEIAARGGPTDVAEAEERYRAALAQADTMGMRPQRAHCHLGLGKLYRRVGRLDEARAELSTAVAMLREMGMMYWLPEAEQELAAIGR